MLSTIPCSGFLYISTIFGTVSSLHLISFLMIFTLVSLPHREHLHNIEGCLPGYLPGYRSRAPYIYAHALVLSAKIRMREMELLTRKMASHIAETSGSHKVAF